MSNSSGQVAVSAVTSTELGYLDGVTSKIQTQLNNKASSSHTHAATAGTISPSNTSKFTYNSGYVYKTAGIVCMCVNIQLKSACAKSTSYTIATIPSGFRPAQLVCCTSCAGVYGDSFYAQVTTAGTLSIFVGLNDIDADETIALNMMWATTLIG